MNRAQLSSHPGAAVGGCRRASHARQGSAALLLIVLLFIAWIMLPLATALIRTAYSQVQILRAGALLDETLAQTSLCLDADALAAGRLEIRADQVTQMITSRLERTTPAILDGRLTVENIQVSFEPVTPDPDHWLKERQPTMIPVVRCTICVTPLTGRSVSLTRSVRFLQSPA